MRIENEAGVERWSARGQTLTWWSWAPLQDSLKGSREITFMLRKDPSGFCVDDGLEGVTLETGIHPGRDEKAKIRQRQWVPLLLLFIKIVARG